MATTIYSIVIYAEIHCSESKHVKTASTHTLLRKHLENNYTAQYLLYYRKY
jgi:hypothetical protein